MNARLAARIAFVSIPILTASLQADNMALRFAGGQCVTIPYRQTLRYDRALTVEVWVFAERARPNSTIIRKNIGTGLENFILRFEDAGQITFHIKLENGVTHVCSSQKRFELNRWRHVAATYDGSLARLLIDGEPAASLAVAGRLMNDPVSTVIGDGDRAAGEAFFGDLDEVRIWRSARTQAEIARDMTIQPIADHPDLLACWSFDSIQGQTVPDESSSGLDGFLGDIRTSDARDPSPVRSTAPISCVDAWTVQPSEVPTAGGRIEIPGTVSLWPEALSVSAEGAIVPILGRTGESLVIEASPHEDGAVEFLVESECGRAAVTLTYRSHFVRGDVDGVSAINIADAIAILNHLFADRPIECVDAADANDDGSLNIGDAIGLLMYLFADGFRPRAPFLDPGPDPTPDGLRCGR